MLSLGFCDDDSVFLTELSDAVKCQLKLKELSFHTECFTDSAELLKQIQLGCQFNGLFLDIEMPGFSGMELAREIFNRNPYLPIVFITNHEELVFDALHLQPLNFIRKSAYMKEIPAVLDSIIRSQERAEEKLLFRYNGQEICCQADEILYIFSAKHAITVVCRQQREFPVTDTIENICKKLSCGSFFKINSGCVVNMQYIMTIETDSIILDNHKQLFVSRRLMPSLKKRFKEFYR